MVTISMHFADVDVNAWGGLGSSNFNLEMVTFRSGVDVGEIARVVIEVVVRVVVGKV